jgi:hypothetical protein
MALRRFSVHGRRLDAAGFEAAALAFVEAYHPGPDVEDTVSLIVEDSATGERQCFRIDLETGAAGPCE